jgi:Cu/Ag efflux protein CusF
MRKSPYLTGCVVLALLCCSCTKDKKSEESALPPDDRTSSHTFTPGEAGGTTEETIKASATVSAIDKETRKITLKNADGTEATFTAPSSMQNFDQLRVGDVVKATVHSQLNVFVDRDAKPGAVHAAMVYKAPKGAKPGAIVAEGFDLIAAVKSIDTAKRQATLEFADGQTKVVTVRPDVDMSKYKVGDSVVIQVFQQLMVVAEEK